MLRLCSDLNLASTELVVSEKNMKSVQFEGFGVKLKGQPSTLVHIDNQSVQWRIQMGSGGSLEAPSPPLF